MAINLQDPAIRFVIPFFRLQIDFLPFTFLLSFSIISPFSMLYSSIYNLFALLGRKANFTHSLKLNLPPRVATGELRTSLH